MKARAKLCPPQPPTRNDYRVSVAQGSTATLGATKQLFPPDKVFKKITYIYIYIYIRRINEKQRYTLRSSSFLVQFVIFKNAFTFSR